MSAENFYVTTPIYYVNDKPHIGHAYTTILADVIARFHRSHHQNVFFLTGLDEHGQKVQQAAEKRGMDPQAHCDDLAPRFLQLWEKLEIRYDDFIRTTEDRHQKIVQKVLQDVYDKGDIYTDEYEGWYSVSEERFITEKEKDSGEFRDVKRIKEKNYFFKMSKYQQQLIDHINANPDFIRPEHRKNEILGFLREPLNDLCISRPKERMSWGIDLPFDTDYVTYVWFDALLNYVSAPGYGSDETKFAQWWPANVHLIGKDILTTHCVYWPTMLMAMGVELPQTVFAHGWWLMGESKMSKSLGNVVSPLDLIEEYGVDAVRYYLMSEMVLGSDASFTLESFIKRFNSDLANDFGNLLNRVGGLIGKYFDGKVPEPGDYTEEDRAIVDQAVALDEVINGHIDKLEIHLACFAILDLVGKANRYMEHAAPWKVAKEDLARAGTILYVATEAVRVAAHHLSPVMPARCAKVLEILGAAEGTEAWGGLVPGTQLPEYEALFPRLETPGD